MIIKSGRRRVAQFAVCGLTVAGVLGVTGCSGDADATEQTAEATVALVSAEDCAWMAPTTSEGPAVTVVVDPTADNPRTLLPPDAAQTIRHASKDNGSITVVIMDGAGAAPATPLLGAALSVPGAGPARRERVADIAVGCVNRVIATAAPTAPGSDELSALQVAARHTPAGGHVVVLSNGISNAGLLDLTTLPAGQVPATDVVAALPRGEIPALPDDSTVTFVGLGETTASEPLTQTARTWVTELNVALCHEAGVEQCPVSPEVGPAAPITADGTTESTEVPDPQVSWPEVHATSLAASTVFDVPAALLFSVDSAELNDDGRQALSAVVAGALDAQQVTVVGHSDSNCLTEQYCLELSQRRADVVADYLISAGVDAAAVTATGVGSSEPAVEDRRPDGSLDEQAAAANRRVTITLD